MISSECGGNFAKPPDTDSFPEYSSRCNSSFRFCGKVSTRLKLNLCRSIEKSSGVRSGSSATKVAISVPAEECLEIWATLSESLLFLRDSELQICGLTKKGTLSFKSSTETVTFVHDWSRLSFEDLAQTCSECEEEICRF